MTARRHLLITGGTGGLGTEVVRRLLREYDCTVLYREEPGFTALAKEVGADRLTGVAADLADADAVNAAVSAAQKSAPLYGLVHLAGGFAAGKLIDTADDAFDAMLDVNLRAALHVIRAFAATFSGTSGRIVAISSEATLTKGAGTVAYTVSKSALNALVEVAAAELREHGVTVNAIAPSSLDTPAMRRVMDRNQLVPLHRVSDAIAWFLSDAASGTSGVILPMRA